jgi:VWFA-related protein
MGTSRTRKALLAGAAGVLLTLAGAAARGQQAPRAAVPSAAAPQVTFKVEVNYVEVGAVVLDRQGRFVSDLRKDDFQVYEDGKPQVVSTFTLVNMPANPAEKPLFSLDALEPDVRSNEEPFAGRLYALVLDDLNTDFAYTQEMRRAAAAFIRQVVREGDVAAVASTSGRLDASQEFTASRRLLLRAVDRFQGRGLQSATVARTESFEAARDLQGNRAPAPRAPTDPLAPERAYNARSTLSAIRRLCDLMAGIRGRRKALVLFGSGIDYNIGNAITDGWDTNEDRAPIMPGSRATREVQLDTLDTIGSATRANVAIYGVDPRGPVGAAATADTPGHPSDASPSLGLNPVSMQQEIGQQQDSLRVLSEGSGGFAVLNTNDLAPAFDRIRDENSTYYVLGYSSGNDRRDGKFRAIQVRTRRPGLEVRARKGYVAPRGQAPKLAKADDPQSAIPPPLRDAMASPLPVSGVRVAAFAAPFRGSGAKPAVMLVLQVDGRDLTFREESGLFKGGVDLSVMALDSEGKRHDALHRAVPMPLKPASFKMVSESGIRIVSRIDLAPGRYQLRIAAMDLGRPPAGAVHYDLEVPDFESVPFSMSGLVLTSSLAGTVPTAASTAIEELRGTLPGPPTLGRQFRSGEDLALLVEVYDRQPGAHTTDIVTTLRTDDGRAILRQEEQRTEAEFAAGKGTIRHTARVPLAGAAPGLYVLRVEARSRLQKAPVAREVQFRIVP